MIDTAQTPAGLTLTIPAAQQFQLLGERTDAEPRWIELQPLIAVLTALDDDTLQLRPVEEGHVPEGAFVLEVLPGASPQLLLRTPRHRHARINGTPAPQLSLLSTGDQVEIDAHPGALLHVCMHCTPAIMPATAAHLGKICPVCRTPVTAGQVVYVCGCTTTIHCEESTPEQERLECARLLTLCPGCQKPVRLQEDHLGVPEAYHG